MTRRGAGKHSLWSNVYNFQPQDPVFRAGYDRMFPQDDSCCQGKHLFVTSDAKMLRCKECEKLWPLDCPQAKDYERGEPVRNLIGGSPFAGEEARRIEGHERTFGRKK